MRVRNYSPCKALLLGLLPFQPTKPSENSTRAEKNSCNNPVSQLAPYFFTINKNKDSIGITTCMQATYTTKRNSTK